MKLINSSFEIIEQRPGLEGIYKQIELAGRVCYKSESSITKDSAKGFVDRMIKSSHLAMCEHGTVYLYKYIENDLLKDVTLKRYNKDPYSHLHIISDNSTGESHVYITTNYRVLIEHDWLDDLQYLCEPTEYHEKRITIKFITDQGILREFSRHRAFSFAVESTRYCNYSSNRFGNELTFIIPPWIDEKDIDLRNRMCEDDWGKLFSEYYYDLTDKGKEEMHFLKYPRDVQNFLRGLFATEQLYLTLLKQGWKPQQARNILPLATKCEIVMTGFVSDWKHFFNLRYFGTTGAPHPQAKELAEPLYNEFVARGYVQNN